MKLFATYKNEKTNQLREQNFKTCNKVILKSTNLIKYYNDSKNNIITESQEFDARDGSPWKLIRVDFLQLRINKYNPMRASSYIDLPIKLKLKKAYINIKNNDQSVFYILLLERLIQQIIILIEYQKII